MALLVTACGGQQAPASQTISYSLKSDLKDGKMVFIGVGGDIDGIVNAFEVAYVSRRDETMRATAREFALDYDADHVLETYWKPALEQIQKPREVAPLRPNGNRAQRRAEKKAKVKA